MGPRDESWRARQRAGLERLLRGEAEATRVPIREAHAAQDRCLTSVAFVPPGIGDELLRDVAEPLRRIDPHHYYMPPGDLHATVKNVRKQANPPTFDGDDTAVACGVFDDVVSRHERFTISLERVVGFDSSIAVFGTAPEAAGRLVTDLDAALRAAGLADDKTYVDPEAPFFNVTVCRFTRAPSAELLDEVKRLRGAVALSFAVDRVQLVVCDAVCSVASREVVGTFRLA